MHTSNAVTNIPVSLELLANGREFLPTIEAAHISLRKPQTLRKWACLGTGPIQPVRQYGRLAWRVSDLASLMNGEV